MAKRRGIVKTSPRRLPGNTGKTGRADASAILESVNWGALFGAAMTATCGFVACSTFGSDGDPAANADDGGPPGSEAGADAAAPASGFQLTLDPPHVTADPGDTFQVAIRLA